MSDEDWKRERTLDRRFEAEPTYGTRKRIPLHERGALRVFFFEKKQPPTVAPAEPSWRPSDGGES